LTPQAGFRALHAEAIVADPTRVPHHFALPFPHFLSERRFPFLALGFIPMQASQAIVTMFTSSATAQGYRKA
jgi:hypothetical protein